jgi:hypothetical protein
MSYCVVVLSLRLTDELKRLVGPYFALGFDQNMVAQNRQQTSVTIGELRTIAYLCKYGRPLYVIHTYT